MTSGDFIEKSLFIAMGDGSTYLTHIIFFVSYVINEDKPSYHNSFIFICRSLFGLVSNLFIFIISPFFILSFVFLIRQIFVNLSS